MPLLTTSAEARDILERFRRSTGVRPNQWARAALGYSLSLEAGPESAPYDSSGSEFLERVFFGEDAPVLLALVRQRAGRRIPEEEVGPLIKRHLERGLRHFAQEYERLNRRGDELLLYLVGLCASQAESIPNPVAQLLPVPPRTENLAARVELGSRPHTSEAVFHTLNGPGSAPHLAIMGRNGTGKTRTGLALLSRVAGNADYHVPFLIFDYAKGDIASNVEFLSSTRASVVALPRQTIPLAPLSIVQADEHSVRLAAHRFRDTITSVVRLGPKQHNRCLQIIEQGYRLGGVGPPDLRDVVDLAEQEYEDNGWPDDSLLACLREFTAFPLFRPVAEGTDHDFFRVSRVLDIHRLPENLRKLTTFLVLDRLYSEIMALPDAPLDREGNRQLRLVIAIDEAHHYLPCRQPTLEKMIREVRSKGVAVWLFSQSPDDFDQPRYNFAREVGLALVFSCVLEKPKMLEAVLGGRIDPKRLSQLSPGVALTRVPTSDTPIEIQAWTP